MRGNQEITIILPCYRVCSFDVTSVILVIQNNETAAMICVKTFRPFLDRKDKGDSTRDIHLNIDGTSVKDQERVIERLAEYFSTMASGIGGTNVEFLDDGEFIDHSSLKSISSMMDESNNSFRLRPVNCQGIQGKLQDTMVCNLKY